MGLPGLLEYLHLLLLADNFRSPDKFPGHARPPVMLAQIIPIKLRPWPSVLQLRHPLILAHAGLLPERPGGGHVGDLQSR